MALITAKILRGFRDFLPGDEELRLELLQQLRQQFRRFGFLAIDTPALEYSEMLLGDAGSESEKQLYRFCDHGKRDVALRFDLTMPFARFVMQHRSKLEFPFKRYQIAKVWRGENPQRGRYREFYQCDFDIVGSDQLSADLDILLLAQRSLATVGAQSTIAINHRGLLDSVFDSFKLPPPHRNAAMRLLDKAGKIDPDQLHHQLGALLGQGAAGELIALLAPQTTLADCSAALGDCPAINQLGTILEQAGQLGLPLVFNPAIVRGLDYYTGIVFESFLDDLGEIGSVCSGGRYDRLTQRFSPVALPGVGGSIGLDRLIAGLAQLNRLTAAAGDCPLFITASDHGHCSLAKLQQLAELIRPTIGCDVYHHGTDKRRSAGQQWQFAAAKGAKLALLLQADDKITIRRFRDRRDFAPLSYPANDQQISQLIATLVNLLEEGL